MGAVNNGMHGLVCSVEDNVVIMGTVNNNSMC